MSQAQALYQVQQIELKIIELTKQVKGINTQLEDDEELRQASEQFDLAETRLTECDKRSAELERELEAVLEKRKGAEAQLYSGRVTNPKELQDMQMEVEALTRRKSQLDDQLLALLESRDHAAAQFEDKNQTLEETKGAHQALHKELQQEKTSHGSEIETLLTKRKAAQERASGAALKTYNAMRKAKGNRPVAVLKDNACTICGIEQDPSVIKAINRGDQLVRCNNCDRILLRL